MPISTFETLINTSMDRISPGSRILTSGVVSNLGQFSQNFQVESLEHSSGRQRIVVGVSRMGQGHVCSK